MMQFESDSFRNLTVSRKLVDPDVYRIAKNIHRRKNKTCLLGFKVDGSGAVFYSALHGNEWLLSKSDLMKMDRRQ